VVLGGSLLHGQLNTYSEGVESACALFPVNPLLSQNNNISLRGLSKSARRRACALGRAWRCFIYKYTDHRFKCDHECALLRLPRVMAPCTIPGR
jgi:hypothetical protein